MCLEETVPYRLRDMIDVIIDHTPDGGYDTVMGAKREGCSLWRENCREGDTRLESGDACTRKGFNSV